MKKTIAYLLTVLIAFSFFLVSVSAESSVDQVQKKVEALSSLPSMESAIDPAYEQTFATVKEAVYALAGLTDWEMEQVEGYRDAFQLYIDLIVLKAKTLLSEKTVTHTNYWDQTVALEQVNDLLFEQEPLFLLAEYTHDTVNDAFHPPETKTGFVSLYEIQLEYHAAEQRRSEYLASLTDQQRYTLKKEGYTRLLSEFPENFTEENVLTYVKDFVMLIEKVEGWFGEYSYINTHSEADNQRYLQLREEFELIMGIYCDFFTDEINRKIEALCDPERALRSSQLQLQLVERPIYDEMVAQLQGLIYINGERVLLNVDNLATFEAYERVFYPDAYMYGDLNGDSSINASDALMALRIAVEKEQVNAARYQVGDLDGDGSVTAKDALLVLQYTVEKIQWFPVEMQLYGILV